MLSPLASSKEEHSVSSAGGPVDFVPHIPGALQILRSLCHLQTHDFFQEMISLEVKKGSLIRG